MPIQFNSLYIFATVIALILNSCSHNPFVLEDDPMISSHTIKEIKLIEPSDNQSPAINRIPYSQPTRTYDPYLYNDDHDSRFYELEQRQRDLENRQRDYQREVEARDRDREYERYKVRRDLESQLRRAEHERVIERLEAERKLRDR